MANLAQALKDEITRLARKEVRQHLATPKKLQAQHRRDIAELKRQIADLERRLVYLEKQEKRRIDQGPAVVEKIIIQEGDAEAVDGRTAPRFQARGLRSHREKLGLSAADYGALVGVSGLTVYNWEKEKSKPRQAQIAKLVEVRQLGKREALRRLEMLDT